MDDSARSQQTLKHIVGSIGFIFSLLSLLGVLFAYREQYEVALPLALVLLFFPLVFYITHASLLTRYRHPIDPIMLVLAVYALAYPVIYWRKRLSGFEAGIPANP